MKKQVQKKLTSTKKKVSNNWIKYQKEKTRILGMRLNSSTKQKKIANLRTKTRQKISYTWNNYQEDKYAITHESNIKGLILEKRRKHKVKDERLYKIKKNANSTKIFDQIKQDKQIDYVLVVLEIKIKETGQIVHVSDSYTPLRLEQFDSNQIINNTLEKFNLKKQYEGYQLISKSIRIIYANTKKSKRR